MNKYELTDEAITVYSRTLYRIRALREIARYGIKAGELGGYIEREENLSQHGDCWVYGDAVVNGNAWVSDNAVVTENAAVSGDAWIYGNSVVRGNARISDHIQLSGGVWENAPIYIRGTRWSCNAAAPDKLCIGCLIHTHDDWRKHWRKIAEANEADEAIVREYMEYYNLIARRMGWPQLEAQS